MIAKCPHCGNECEVVYNMGGIPCSGGLEIVECDPTDGGCGKEFVIGLDVDVEDYAVIRRETISITVYKLIPAPKPVK